MAAGGALGPYKKGRGYKIMGNCIICNIFCKLTNKQGGRRKTCGLKECKLQLNKLTHPQKMGKCLICYKEIHLRRPQKTCSLNCLSKLRSMQGKNHILPSRKGISPSNKGKKFPQLSGVNSPSWKEGISRTNRILRKSYEYNNWRKKIYERDLYTCQICGRVGKDLRANHIKRFSDYPELRFNLSNGITICKNCDYKWVFNHELEWESYFNFNLMNRNIGREQL